MLAHAGESVMSRSPWLWMSLGTYLCWACGSSPGTTKSSVTKIVAGRGGDSVIMSNPAKRAAGAGGHAGDDAGAPASVGVGVATSNAGSGEAGSGGTAGTAGRSASEGCAPEATLRCSSAGGGHRERCQAAEWKSTSGCAAAEVCIENGVCEPVSKLCLGSAGQAVCDGAVLHVCNADGTEAAQHTCTNARQCQAGLSTRDCAACPPGEYRCSGARLELCGPDGKSWGPENTCDTAALCNASAHACTQGACLPNTFMCAGDMLRKCRDDQTGFSDQQACSAGTCDAKLGKCLACIPGKKSCDGSRALTCKADGSSQDERACTGTTPYCAPGSGECVQCTDQMACKQPTQTCRVASCNLGSGVCEQQMAPEGTDCATLTLTGGRCNRQGTCVECLDDSHCAGKLARSRCNALSGLCSECASDAECDRQNFQGCSLLGQCVDVAGCGNRVVDALAGEECDPTAPNWSTETCDPNRCTRRIYQSCGVLSGRCSADSCSAARVCVGSCEDAADCRRLPGYSTECGDNGQCYLPCNGGLSAPCPLGLFCNTDLVPAQCAGVL
jgi:hypothetical protein